MYNMNMKKIYGFSSFFAFLAGVVLVSGGLWGLIFTQETILREKIITPDDATIPGERVNGPLTLMAQAEVIRKHTLKSTGGLTYAQMPRQLEKRDENGNFVLGEDGKPVMVPNEARNLWITATTLTTALNLGVITYMFGALIMVFGLISIWNGCLFFALYRKTEI